jgi:hypothetical protein
MCGISDDDIYKSANIMVAKGNINIFDDMNEKNICNYSQIK